MSEKKPRRQKGAGSIYQVGNGWMAQYRHPDGSLKRELCRTKSDANRLLRKRLGAKEHGLPVIPGVEKTTFEQGAQAVLDDFRNTGKKSGDEVARRIKLHLAPFFGGRRLISIMPDEVRRYTTKRKSDTFVVRKARLDAGGTVLEPEVRRPVSNAEINRELQVLKRIFSLAVKDGRLPSRPHIDMLREDNVRQGFFEAHQYESVLKHLPEELQPVITFAYVTGWRIASEVLPMEWSQVDFTSGEVRLEAGTTKNGDGRVMFMTAELRRVLQDQATKHDALKKTGHIVPWVFWRMVADGRGGPKKPQAIISMAKAWKRACLDAGCPGRIPHDLRRTAVRNLTRVGVATAVAKKITGHKTDSVFRRYDIVSESDLREAARMLDAAPAATARRTAST